MATSKTNTASTPKPAQTIRCGACWATIWENLGPDGPFYSATLMRPFRDASGNWRNSTRTQCATLKWSSRSTTGELFRPPSQSRTAMITWASTRNAISTIVTESVSRSARTSKCNSNPSPRHGYGISVRRASSALMPAASQSRGGIVDPEGCPALRIVGREPFLGSTGNGR